MESKKSINKKIILRLSSFPYDQFYEIQIKSIS